jgi:cell division septation protein DedD
VSVETPPPEQRAAPAQPGTRRCPRCGAGLTEQQEWCLACGTAVGTRVVSAPGWRTPLYVLAAILLIAAIALAIAIIQLADDTGEVQQNPPAASVTPTPSPIPTTTATVTPTITPEATIPEASGKETPTATATATPSGSGSADAEWPAGETGWTIVLASETSEDAARQRAEDLAASGIGGVGVLAGSDYGSLDPDRWIVFTGVYDDQAEASAALDTVDAKGAYIRRIQPD